MKLVTSRCRIAFSIEHNHTIYFDGDDALRLRLDGDDVTDQINMTQGFQLSEGDSESTLATLFEE